VASILGVNRDLEGLLLFIMGARCAVPVPERVTPEISDVVGKANKQRPRSWVDNQWLYRHRVLVSMRGLQSAPAPEFAPQARIRSRTCPKSSGNDWISGQGIFWGATNACLSQPE